MSKHAYLSASSAHRWMECPGSVAATLHIPDEPNEWTAEGTLAHSLAESMLRNRVFKEGVRIDAALYPPEMFDYCEAYCDYVDGLITDETEVFIEKQVSYSNVTNVPFIKDEEDSYGTPDVLLITKDKVDVIDFKYGKGVKVYAEGNPQLLLYGLSAELDEISLHIFQPRLDHVDVWGVDRRSEFVDDFVRAVGRSALSVAAALEGGFLYYKAGEHCRFCKLAGSCRAQSEFMLEGVLDGFDTIDELDGLKPKSPECSNEELEKILGYVPMIEDWCKSVAAVALKRAMDGEEFTNFKLVKGREGNRKWADEGVVKEIAGPDAVKEVTRSPAELEKFLPRKENESIWRELDNEITRSEGKPTLASVNDSREKIVRNHLEGFDDLS